MLRLVRHRKYTGDELRKNCLEAYTYAFLRREHKGLWVLRPGLHVIFALGSNCEVVGVVVGGLV